MKDICNFFIMTNCHLPKDSWKKIDRKTIERKTVERIGLLFLQQRFPKLWDLNRICFLNNDNFVKKGYTKIWILSEIVLLCCFCKNISANSLRLAMLYLKHLYGKSLNVSTMNRDRPIFFQEFFIRWQFVIMKKSRTSFMLVLYFVVILAAVKHPNQETIIKFCVKKKFIEIFLFPRFMYSIARTCTRNFRSAFLHRTWRWSSKRSFELILIPSSFSQSALLMIDSPTWISEDLSLLKSKWHLSAFPFRAMLIQTYICLFKFSNRNTRNRCEICSKSTIITPEQR